MLYQVATAALSPSNIASPIRSILRHQMNVEVVLGEAARLEEILAHAAAPLRASILSSASAIASNTSSVEPWRGL